MVNGGCTCSSRVGMTTQSCWGETSQGTNLGEKNQFGSLLFFSHVLFIQTSHFVPRFDETAISIWSTLQISNRSQICTNNLYNSNFQCFDGDQLSIRTPFLILQDSLSPSEQAWKNQIPTETTKVIICLKTQRFS